MAYSRRLVCPNCSTHVTSEHVNMQKMVGICPKCDHVFSFEGMMDSADKIARKVKAPQTFAVDTSPDRLAISYQRRSHITQQDWGMVGGLLGGGVGGFLTLLILALVLPEVPTAVRVIGGSLMAFGFLACMYPIAGLFLNTVRIYADDYEVGYEESPLPLFSRRFATQEISDINVSLDMSMQYNMQYPIDRDYAQHFGIWRVEVEGAGSDKRKLIGRLSRPSAQYIQQELRSYLFDTDTEAVDFIHLTDDETAQALYEEDASSQDYREQ